MQIGHLKHFEALYRLRSFADAADQCYVSQSALSRSVKSLETEIGERLFDRTTHSVAPTAIADELVAYAIDVLQAMSAFAERADTLRHGTIGHVRIGTGPYPARPLLTRVVRAISRSNAGVQVSVVAGSSEYLLESLVRRELDFVVCDISKYERLTVAGDIVAQPLPPEPLALVYAQGHPLARGGAGEAAMYPWALPTPSPVLSKLLDAPIAADIETGKFPFYRVETTAACLDIVADRRTITMVPLSLAVQECPARGLVYIPGTEIPIANLETNDGIHTLEGRTLSPAAEMAIGHVRRQAEQIAGATATS